MPIVTNNLFQRTLTQPDPDVTVWRFMDLTAFLAMIQTKELAFGRADKMNDPWEGAYSDPKLEKEDLEPGERLTPPVRFGGKRHSLEQLINLNSWYVSDHESFGMWEVYKHSGQGIGVKTTWGKLTESIDPSSQLTVFGGSVNYVDYLETSTRQASLAAPFFYKRVPFQSEQEARLVVIGAKFSDTTEPTTPRSRYNHVEELAPIPLKVEVDLSTMVEDVVLAPASGPWIVQTVQKCIDNEGFDWSVQNSGLDRELWRK